MMLTQSAAHQAEWSPQTAFNQMRMLQTVGLERKNFGKLPLSRLPLWTLLFKFLNSDFLLLCCLKGAGFSLISSYRLFPLYLQVNLFPYVEKWGCGCMHIVRRLSLLI